MTAHDLAPPAASRPDPLEALSRSFPLPGLRLPALLLVAGLGGFIAWAHIAQVDEVVIAPGRVVPSSQVKTIQHLEGGILSALNVREGQRVKAGEVLAQIDLATRGINQEELWLKLDTLELQLARLEAEAGGGDLSLPSGPAERRPDLAAKEQATFASRRTTLEQQLAIAGQVLTQRQRELEALQVKAEGLQAALPAVAEQAAIARRLASRGLGSRNDALRAEREAKTLEGEAAAVSADLPRIAAAVAEAEARVQDLLGQARSTAAAEAGAVAAELSRQRALQAEASAQRKRAEIVAPIEGVVENLRFTTLNAVLAPGEALMDLVPVDERLVIEARVNPADIGFVHASSPEAALPATVKLTTYDFLRYGALNGQVMNVAANAESDERGNHYFRVVVHTDDRTLTAGSRALPITSGMEAQVEIRIGEKRVIDYLLQPMLKLRAEAFRER